MRRFAWSILAVLGAGCASAAPKAIRARASTNEKGSAAPLLEVVPRAGGTTYAPEFTISDPPLGEEPGGGARRIVGGYRLITWPGGGTESSADRLPSKVTTQVDLAKSVLALPARLGGGFLFVAGDRLLRSSTWLGPATEFFSAGRSVQTIYVGFDRIYVGLDGPEDVRALDPRSGAPLDRGGWPPSPSVSFFVAVDEWRAIATADLLGTIATFDAGATWIPLDRSFLPIDAKIKNGRWLVLTSKPGRGYEIFPNGRTSPMNLQESPAPPNKESTRSWLARAVESGWPLEDGTIVFIEDANIVRVRASNGNVESRIERAIDLPQSKCQAIRAFSDIGFVCSVKDGPTVLYAYEAEQGLLREAKRFNRPRQVTGSGNGGVIVRGPCTEESETAGDNVYCVLAPGSGIWREAKLRGSGGRERLTVLRDGRLLVLSPPGGDAPGQLTIVKGTTVLSSTLDLSACDTKRVRPAESIWLDGFEERLPHRISGWLQNGERFASVEIDDAGKVAFCQEQPSSGPTLPSGRFALQWLSDGSGRETIDGGKTWTDVRLPEPKRSMARPVWQGCGAGGCVANGWVRSGWQGSAMTSTSDAHARLPTSSTTAPRLRPTKPLDLECILRSRDGETESRPTRNPRSALTGRPTLSRLIPGSETNAFFFGFHAPTDRPSEGVDLRDPLKASGPALGRVYTWAHDDLSLTARDWSFAWVDPFGVRAPVYHTLTQTAPTGWMGDGTASASIARYAYSSAFGSTLVVAEDARRALAILKSSRASDGELRVVSLEGGASAVLIRRADGDIFRDIESAVRMGERWYVASRQRDSEGASASVVWAVEGDVARPVARIPRLASTPGRPAGASRLVAHSNRRQLGLLVESTRTLSERWLVPIDPESGALGPPENMGSIDFLDRPEPRWCSAEETGWQADMPWGGSLRVRWGPSAPLLGFSDAIASLRFTSERFCLRGLRLAMYGASAIAWPEIARANVHPHAPETPPLSLVGANQRAVFSCTIPLLK